MSVFFVFLLSTLALSAEGGVTCDLTTKPATWATITAKNVFFNAYEPDNYFNTPGFCVNNDFMSHTLVYESHVKLANPSAKVQHDTASNTFDNSRINCGTNDTRVQYCQSHCSNKQLETLIVSTAVINGSLPLSTAQQVFRTLGSPNDTSIASIQVDLNAQNLKIDYDYYDDANFCSVFVRIKNPTMFPYALFVTVQKILGV
uniref:CUB_2 domain-containing protein n=1 Tax=Caenorhabditis tropicalis TaxID=1561998 RepID=A0A1I7V4D9_9PELO